MNNNLLYRYIYEVLSIPSPSGYTKQIEEYISNFLKSLDVEFKVGNKGNILATIEGEENNSATTFLIHVDTLGAMVKEIKENGRLGISLIGEYVISSVEGENCIIHTRNNKKYEGTLQNIKPSIHIYGEDANKVERTVENYEIIIDEELYCKDDVIKLGIDVGDIVSFDTRTKITSSGFIKSRYLDDKAGLAAVLYIINYIKLNQISLKNTINFLFTNYEEVGHGASSLIPKNIKNLIAIDFGCLGDNQNSTEDSVSICSKDLNGPYDYELISNLVDLCKENYIRYNLDIYENYCSDAISALSTGIDAKFALIGPSIYASHGYERTHIKSIEETIKLIIKYITK